MADNDTGTTPAPEPASGLSRFVPALPPILRGPFELANVAERAFRLSQAQRPQAQQPPLQSPALAGTAQGALPPAAAPMPPPTVPAPPPIRYSYIPPKADTPPESLGKPWWPIEAAHRHDGPVPESQHIPSPRDGYRYGGQASGYFAKMGAPAVAGPAQMAVGLLEGFAPILDWLSGGGFSRNYSASSMLGIQRQLGALKVQQEQAMLNMEMAADAQRKIDERYGRVFTLATTMGKDGQPLLSGDELHDAVRDIANEEQDNSVLIALDNGGLPQAIKTMQKNQQQRLMLEASHVAVKKATAGERSDAEIQAEYGETTDQSGQGLGTSSAFNFPTGEKEAPVGAAPAEEEAPEKNEFDEAALKKGFTAKEIRDAHRTINEAFDPNTSPSTKGSPTVVGKINDLVGSMDEAIGNIAAGPADDPDHPENSKIEQIRKIDKDYAAELEGLKNYDLDPNDTSKKNRRHLANIAREVFPGYKEGFYKTYHNQWDNPSSPIGVKIQAANRASSQLTSLIRIINSLPFKEDGSFPADTVARVLAGSANDPVFGELNEAMGSFAREAVQTQTGSRGGSVAFVNQLMKSFNPAEGKAGLRAAVRRSVGGLMNITDQYNRQFQKDSGLNTDMPGFDPEAREIIQGVVTGNPYNGKFSKNAPEELKMISPFGLDPNNDLKYRGARPSWWRPEMDFEPMDYSDYQARLQWLKEHPDDPRAPEVRQRLGSSR